MYGLGIGGLGFRNSGTLNSSCSPSCSTLSFVAQKPTVEIADLGVSQGDPCTVKGVRFREPLTFSL